MLSKIGTEFFKIDKEMTEKNEAEDGNSISLKSPCLMKWDRQQFPHILHIAWWPKNTNFVSFCT